MLPSNPYVLRPSVVPEFCFQAACSFRQRASSHSTSPVSPEYCASQLSIRDRLSSSFREGVAPCGTLESMDLDRVIIDMADVLKRIDNSGATFKDFRPGIGPFGEPQLVKLVAAEMSLLPRYSSGVSTMRTPDLLIHKHWALEIKIARPFGDNNRLAENWSVNLLHPYAGNTSLLGDCLKLQLSQCEEKRGVLAIGYEHEPAKVDLEPLWRGFELLAAGVMNVNLGARAMARRTGLIHPVHQQVIVAGWQMR